MSTEDPPTVIPPDPHFHGPSAFEEPENVYVCGSESVELPPEWSSHFDETYQTNYYMHDPTGHTQWEFPTAQKEADCYADPISHSTESSAATEVKAETEVPWCPAPKNPYTYSGYSLPIGTPEAPSSSQRPNFNKLVLKPSRKKLLSSSQYSMEGYATETAVQWYGSEDVWEEDQGDGSDEPYPMYSDQLDALNLSGYEESFNDGDEEESEVTSSPTRNEKKKERWKTRGGTNKDYENMARLYRIERPYSDPSFPALCLLCHKNYAQDVFFPCEHHCVCRQCIHKEHICEESMLTRVPDAYINCSLCAAIIKRILPLENGAEVEKYWQWVLEEHPPLPTSFVRDFKHSEGVIKTVYVTDKYKAAHGEPIDGDESKLCMIS